MLDTFKHKGLRKRLVEELREKGITNEAVLMAFDKVPRHLFLDSSFDEIAYQNRAYAIACGQTISQPYTVAFQTQLLNITKNEKVLEIGTGSGFQTCILCELGAKVFTIERQKPLYHRTKEFIRNFGYIAKCFLGDGYAGLPAYAPFDKIIVTCGAPIIPQPLINQLKIGGRLVIPVGEESQEMICIIKKSEEEIEKQEYGSFKFVPMLEKYT